MAGGKETPRQKMIGMMYLVLTALLALNVSKQIIQAFITLNDKLESSAMIINNQAEDNYSGFDKKRAGLQVINGDMRDLDYWQARADNLKKETATIIGFLLAECNEMIKTSEGEDWIAQKDENGNITELKSLQEIQGMDNYDIPTNLFVGGNPEKPSQRGMDLRNKIHAYRDVVLSLMGTYQERDKKWEFVAPATKAGLTDALKTANPEDTAKLAQFYEVLTIPEYLDGGLENGEQPWVSVTFDHAPIVAAAAMFTSLKLDIKNAEALASEFMLEKIDAPIFNFNKIEPMAFASSGYVNAGDPMGLKVMIAAYDSNDVAMVRYGVDSDTANPENWIETDSALNLPSTVPGPHKVKGQIGVRQKGELVWKDWEYNYNVGQPMGVVGQPEMRVLYWGYDNVVEGTASGFAPDKVTLRGNGCRIVRQGNRYIAHVDRGTRNATISVSGQKEDGTTVNLGVFDFVCKPLPDAKIYFNRYVMGDEVPYVVAKSQPNVRIGMDPSVILKDINYRILSGIVVVQDVPGQGRVLAGGTFDAAAKSKLLQSKGKLVSITVKYSDPSGITKTGGISINVKS